MYPDISVSFLVTKGMFWTDQQRGPAQTMAHGLAQKLNATVGLLKYTLFSNLFQEQIIELVQLNSLKKEKALNANQTKEKTNK